MTENTSKEKKKQRSFRKKPSSSRKVLAEDPSAIAITTATSTGIEASLLEKNESKDSPDEIQFPKKSKKKKKSKSSDSQKSYEDIGESTKSLGRKSKKSKKDAIGESIKPTTTKVPSMFASASPRTKKKKSKDSSGHGKKDHSGHGKKDHSGHGKKSKTKSKTKEDRDSSGKDPSSSANGSKPIATSASKPDPEVSVRDIKLATPLDNTKRESAIRSLTLLPSFSTIGDSSMDDDDMPFWKRSSHGSRRNSPIASLEEDDTIFTKDEDYVKLGKYQYPGMKPETKRQVVTAPPLSDEDDSDYEDSSSSDEEPEWLRKKKMFESKGPIGGERVAYEPPPKEPEPPAESEQDAEEEEEKPKESLPPWANARKALKKTNSIRITADSATVVKEKEVKPENKQENEEEKDESMAGLPSWAQARRANIKKTESKRTMTTGSPKTSTSPKIAPKQTEVKAEKEEASKTGLPAWAQARRTTLKKSESARNTEAPWAKARQTSLKKSESARDTNAPVKAVEKDTEKEQVKEDEQDTAKSGLPSWATARKTLKPSGSRTNIVATSPPDGDDKGEKKNEEAVVETEKKPAWVGKKRTEVKKKSISVDSSTLSVQTTESETDASDGQPPWAKARNSLKATSTHSVNSSAPTEKVRNSGEAKSSGVPLWAKKNSAVIKEATDATVSAKVNDNGDEDKPDVKAEEDAQKSVKDRLSVWGKPNQSRPPRAQSERNVTSTTASISKKPMMGKSLSERSMSSTGSQDSQATSDSHKNRMAAYLENTRKKSDAGKPPIPGIPRGSNRSVKDRSKAWGESNHSSRDGDTSSIGTGSVHSTSSPVPDYTAGRMALKKVKKDDKPSGDKDRESAPKLIRMYSSENLKKVTPPSPGKKKQDSLGSSSHSAPKLRKVGKPNEQKWKEKKTDDSEKEESPIVNLKKVSPPDEKKWMSPKVQGEGAEKLYSSQHENLRSVKPPLEEESPGSVDSLDSPDDDAAEFAEASEDEHLNDKESNDASDELPTNDNLSEGKEDNSVEEPTSTENSDDTETSESDGAITTTESTPEKNITIEKGESESSEKEDDKETNGAEVVVENATSVDDAVEGDSPAEEINNAAIDSDSDDTDIAANTAVTSGDGEPSEEEAKDLEKNDEGKIGSEDDERVQEQSASTVPANDEHVEDNNLIPMPLTPDSEVKETKKENDLSKEDASESVEGDNSLPPKEDESSEDNAVNEGGDSAKDDDSVNEAQETIEDEVPPATSLKEETEEDGADIDSVEKEGDSEETEKSPLIPSSEVDTVEAETEADEVEVEVDGSQIVSTSTSDIEMKEDIKGADPVDAASEKSNPDPADSSKDDDEEQSVPQQNDTNAVNDIGDDNESSDDGDKNEEQSIDVNELPSDSSNDNEEASTEGETSDKDPENIVSSPAAISSEGKVALEPEGKVALDAEERLIPVNFGDENEEERKELKKTTEVDLQEALEQSNSELMKMLEQSGIFSDESAQAAISLSSFFDDKETKKSDVDKDGTRSANSNDSSNNGSKQKPMSMKSLSDHLNRSSSGGKSSGGFMSEASPVDEESSGGWSDDDEATIKSEFTDITYGTLGSALVVDATAMTTSADAAKKLRKMVSAKAAQSQEDIIPGPPPDPPDPPPISKGKSPKKPRSAKASSGGDILFKPPRPLGASDDSDSDGDEDNTRKSGVSTKKNKKKKKSKKPKDREIDVGGLFDEDDSPKKEKKKDKKKKKEKKKVPTLEEDIVFDCNENVGVEDTGAVERSKKKKKKKKRKGETGAGSGDDSP